MTYAELLAAFPLWVGRAGDTSLTASASVFLGLAEAKINRVLRCREMVARTTAALDDEFCSVPDDFAEIHSFSLDGDPLIYLTPQAMNDQHSSDSAGGQPRFYTIVGGEFRLFPAPDQSYTAALSYYQKVPALTETATTNWLSVNHPDVYLYAVCLEVSVYLADDADTAKYGGLLERVIADLNADTSAIGDTLQPVAVVV